MPNLLLKPPFFSDDRERLQKLTLPTLILQSKQDNLASVEIGEYMHEKMPNSTLEVIDSHGHCLHMTDPETVFHLINTFLDE